MADLIPAGKSGRPRKHDNDALPSLYPKGSKARAAHENVGIYTSKRHKAEQAKALIMEAEKSDFERIEQQVNQIIAKYTF